MAEKRKKVLDVGTGFGLSLFERARKRPKVHFTGLDPEPTRLKFAEVILSEGHNLLSNERNIEALKKKYALTQEEIDNIENYDLSDHDVRILKEEFQSPKGTPELLEKSVAQMWSGIKKKYKVYHDGKSDVKDLGNVLLEVGAGDNLPRDDQSVDEV
ncbi:MAG: class I SAM-dependent methyltransferase, partial [Candidatus Diapherotrites archaeon]|nr:class I SAM-dependent methyltransferase [Candidatus Diapherotrites archaeon]